MIKLCIPFLKKHLLPLSVIALIAFISFGQSFEIRPFDGDCLIELSHGVRSTPTHLFTEKLTHMPAYRPVAHLTTWLQYKLVGLNSVESYFMFNLIVWITVIWTVYAFIYIYSQSRLSAAIISIFLLLDRRALYSMIWIGERQSTLACLFGFIAILLALTSLHSNLGQLKKFLIFFFLLFSALSKEYGIAFSGAILFLFDSNNPNNKRALIWIAVSSVVVYFAMRALLASGASGDYCEDMGFFFSERRICYSKLNYIEKICQHLYNIGASFVGTIFPTLFNEGGRLYPMNIAKNKVLSFFTICLFGFVLVGVYKKPKMALPMVILILCNAILSFMLYRPRNHLVGMIGLYCIAGVGLSYLITFVRIYFYNTKYMVMSVIVIMFLVISFGNFIIFSKKYLSNHKNKVASLDPCNSLSAIDDFSKEIIRQVKIKYKLDNPGCKDIIFN